ncbi:MAG: hypothetical protein IJM81_09420 [Prevotella sp.]|nr:hypothetical protein [Prevotella sp.]
MKKVFLLFAVAAFSLSSMAQIEKDGYKLAVTLENPAEGSSILPVIVELTQPVDESTYGWGFQIDFPGFEGKSAADVIATNAFAGAKVQKGKPKFSVDDATVWTDRAKSSLANIAFATADANNIGKLICNWGNNSDPVTGMSGEVFRINYNTEYLADGEYTITIGGPNGGEAKLIYYDDEAESNVVIAESATYTVKFKKEDGKVSGVNRVVVDDENEKQEIYNVQGMKIRQTVPGRLYIVNGKKVIAQ